MAERLARYEGATGGLRLSEDFLPNLEASVARFNTQLLDAAERLAANGSSPKALSWQQDPAPRRTEAATGS